jgi:hypothetical protein
MLRANEKMLMLIAEGHTKRALTSRNTSKLVLEYLEVTGDLFAIASNTRVPVDRILNQLIPSSLRAFEHVFLPTHWWPSDECYTMFISLCARVTTYRSRG